MKDGKFAWFAPYAVRLGIVIDVRFEAVEVSDPEEGGRSCREVERSRSARCSGTSICPPPPCSCETMVESLCARRDVGDSEVAER